MDAYGLRAPNSAPWWSLLVILARAILAVEVEGVDRRRCPKQVIKFGLQRLLKLDEKSKAESQVWRLSGSFSGRVLSERVT